MKNYFKILFILCSGIYFSQVGIGTENPTETLDVVGTARIRHIENYQGDLAAAKDSIVVFNSDGILKYVSSNMVVSSADPSLFPNNENFTTGTANPLVTGNEKTGDTYFNSSGNSWWYFNGSAWMLISSPSLDDDPANEIQTLSIAGNDVSLSNGGGTITLPAVTGSETVVQGSGATTITGTGTSADPYIVSSTDNVNDADADPANEIQNISTDGTAGNIALSSGATLTLNVNDADADVTNEIQTLSITGNDVSLSNGGGSITLPAVTGSETVVQGSGATTITGTGTSADPYIVSSTDNVNDADADPANEIQTLSIAGNDVSLSNGGGTITLPAVTGSETVVQGSGATTITGTGTSADPYIVSSTDNVNDADADPANEIQTLSIAGNDVSLSNGGGTITLPAVTGSETVVQGSGATTITGTGTSADPYIVSSTDNVNDADADPANEIQTLSIAGNDVSLSNGGGSITLPAVTGSETVVQGSGATTITGTGTSADPYIVSSTDNVNDADADPANEIQTLSITGNDVSLSNGGGSITLPAVTGSETVVQGSGATTITGTGTSADPYIVSSTDNVNDADADPANEIQNISTDGTAGNIALSSGATLTLNVNDADADASNEIQTLTSTGGSILLTATNDDYNLEVNPANEPWYSVANNTGSTSNTEDIYHVGNVMIGASTAPTHTLDVNGEARIRTITEGSGTTMVADATGVVKKVSTVTFGDAGNGKIATFKGDIDVSGTIDPTRILFSNLAGVDSPTYVPSANANAYRIEFEEGGDLNFKSDATDNIMHLNNDGNIGVGTDAPTAEIHVSRLGDAVLMLEADTDNVDEDDNPSIILKQDGNQIGGVIGISNSLINPFYIDQISNSVYIASEDVSKNAGIQFVTGGDVDGTPLQGTARMSILANGRVGIGTIAPTETLSVNGTAGKPGGGTWATFSDIRTKKDVQEFNDGLEVIMQLNPISFKYNQLSGYKDLDSSYIGFSAQEIEKVAPYMVKTIDDSANSGLVDKRELDDSALTKILVNAIQEQQRQIEALQKKIEELSK